MKCIHCGNKLREGNNFCDFCGRSMEEPVAPHAESILPVDPSPEMMLASTAQRFGTMVLDMIFYIILSFFCGIFLAIIGMGDLLMQMNEHLIGAIIMLIYYVPQEALFGRTLGKLITGTKAVNEDGSKLTIGQAIGRTLCRFIPFEAFSFLGGKGRPRGWHDSIAKSIVITLRG